jgi:hypothetical protein
MKILHLYSFCKETNYEFNQTIGWDNDEELKLETDNFHSNKNHLFYPNNSYWSFYTDYELTPTEEEIIGVQYGDRLEQEKLV